MTLCSYCQKDAQLLTGREVYPHRRDLYAKLFWVCSPCKAMVGCHPGTEKPLGRLADAALRAAKQKAHAAFDPLWKEGTMKRGDAYAWLADAMGLARGRAHIGEFDLDQCRRVVEAVNAR